MKFLRLLTLTIVAVLIPVLLMGCTIQITTNPTGTTEPPATKPSNHQTTQQTQETQPSFNTQTPNQSDRWKSNLMTAEPMEIFGIQKKELVNSVTFLDSTAYAPEKPWNLGKDSSPRVLGWVEWVDSKAEVYFAADGGINGELCTEGMFAEYPQLREIHFNGAFHTENATSMKNMFYGCENLRWVDVETLDTSNVTTMYQMFRNCYALEELDLSNFNTAKVTDMYCMFSTCYSLEKLDLGSFDTSRVTNMGYMFSACRALEDVNVSSFNTSRVTNMEGTFRWCYALYELDLSHWDVRRVTNHASFMEDGSYICGQPWKQFFK